MARRGLHLTVSALVLFSLLLSTRLSAPAAHATPLAGGLHIGLKALYKSPVFADTSEVIKLAAIANEDTLPNGERIVIGDWDGRSFSHRVKRCKAGESSCFANDRGGHDGSFNIKAAVVDSHNNVLAQSKSVIVHRQRYTLTIDVGDKAGTLTTDGKQLSGVTTTFTMHAPQGAASSWASIGLYYLLSTSDTWTLAGEACAPHPQGFDCARTDAEESAYRSEPIAYRVQAVDAQGTIRLASSPETVTWVPWPVHVTVNKEKLPGGTLPVVRLSRRSQAAIEVTTDQPSLQLGDQQFHLVIEEHTEDSVLVRADCTTQPCRYTANAPPDNCGLCDTSFRAFVTDVPGRVDDSALQGTTDFNATWLRTGYQFSGIKITTTEASQNCNANFTVCSAWSPDSPIQRTITGSVCGEPYTDAWYILVRYGPGTAYVAQPTFDRATELALPADEVGKYVLMNLGGSYGANVKVYLHGVPGADTGGKVPAEVRFVLDVPGGLVTYSNPQTHEQFRFSGLNQTVVAPVTTRDDCP